MNQENQLIANKQPTRFIPFNWLQVLFYWFRCIATTAKQRNNLSLKTLNWPELNSKNADCSNKKFLKTKTFYFKETAPPGWKNNLEIVSRLIRAAIVANDEPKPDRRNASRQTGCIPWGLYSPNLYQAKPTSIEMRDSFVNLGCKYPQLIRCKGKIKSTAEVCTGTEF